MIIKPMIRNSICMNAHPVGCGIQVNEQIQYVRTQGSIPGPKSALIIGASTGYGLASRIASSFACGAPTIGVSYERPGSEKRSGTAGWYNSVAFDHAARVGGIDSTSINGDAFSDEVKQQAIDAIRRTTGTVDLVIYSLAAPVRTDPVTGITYKSVLKPIGESFSSRTADPFTGETSEFTIEPAADEEIEATVKVMGGEDWRLWIEALADAGVLSEGATTVAYSYIGPPATQSMYRHGTIGRAKEHLENTASELNNFLDSLNGRAFVSVNKALVTRASAVIPVVPLYISLLYRVMKEKSIHENCIHQVYRLFRDRLFVPSVSKDVTQDVTNPSRRYDPPLTDDVGRIRMDDYEMREDVQREVAELWERTENEDANKLADFAGYRETFLQFHGFDVNGVDYSADVAP